MLGQGSFPKISILFCCSSVPHPCDLSRSYLNYLKVFKAFHNEAAMYVSLLTPNFSTHKSFSSTQTNVFLHRNFLYLGHTIFSICAEPTFSVYLELLPFFSSSTSNSVIKDYAGLKLAKTSLCLQDSSFSEH